MYSNLLALQDELDTHRLALHCVREAIAYHCRALDALKVAERVNMAAIREYEEILPAQTEGEAVMRRALVGQPVEWVREVV